RCSAASTWRSGRGACCGWTTWSGGGGGGGGRCRGGAARRARGGGGLGRGGSGRVGGERRSKPGPPRPVAAAGGRGGAGGGGAAGRGVVQLHRADGGADRRGQDGERGDAVAVLAGRAARVLNWGDGHAHPGRPGGSRGRLTEPRFGPANAPVVLRVRMMSR